MDVRSTNGPYFTDFISDLSVHFAHVSRLSISNNMSVLNIFTRTYSMLNRS